jgi:hypothetical protein
MGPSRFTSIRKEGVLPIFIALIKSIALAGFETATFGSSGKHTNHYTTKATYKTIIRPITLCGNETWIITGKMASALMTWERKFLRKIYAPKCEKRGMENKKQPSDTEYV